MLVTLNEILAIAEERKCAIGAFNTPNLEFVVAVIRAAEKLNVPYLGLETDYTPSDSAQLATRIQAFLELM